MSKYQYEEKYTQKVLEHCKSGGFIETLPSKLGIPFNLIKQWSKVYTDFDDAISVGLAHTMQYWISKLEETLCSDIVDSARVNIYKAFIDRCFKNYDDKLNVDQLGNNDRININHKKDPGRFTGGE